MNENPYERIANEEPLTKGLRILRSWVADANEYPSWAHQYREKVSEAIALIQLHANTHNDKMSAGISTRSFQEQER